MPETFKDRNMDGTVFDDVSMRDSRFTNMKMEGATFHDVSFRNVTVTSSSIIGMTIDGISVAEALNAWHAVHPAGNLTDRH